MTVKYTYIFWNRPPNLQSCRLSSATEPNPFAVFIYLVFLVMFRQKTFVQITIVRLFTHESWLIDTARNLDRDRKMMGFYITER